MSCCRRYAGPRCSRVEFLGPASGALFGRQEGIEEELSQLYRTHKDDAMVRIGPARSPRPCARRFACCFCAMLAVLNGVLAGVFLTPRKVSGKLSGLRLTGITLPTPGGNASDLALEYQGTLTIQNPNLMRANVQPSFLAIFYGDAFLGYARIQGMQIDGQSSGTSEMHGKLTSVPEEVGRAMMQDMATSNGLLKTIARARVKAELPIMNISAVNHVLALEAELMMECALTSDVQKLPEFSDRSCNTTSISTLWLLNP